MEKSDAQYTMSDTNITLANITNLTNMTETQVILIMCPFLILICMLFNTIITSLKKIHDLIYSIDRHHPSHVIDGITRTSINSDHDTHLVREENDLKTNAENDDYSPPPYSFME